LLSLNKIKSHQNKLLVNHLTNVANLSVKIFESKEYNLSNFINKDILKNICYINGLTHDFGKATKFFQDYINEQDENIKTKLKNKPQTHHSFLSSVFTYYLVKEYLTHKNVLKSKFYEYLPIICFIIVKRHHGNLINAIDETYGLKDRIENLLIQINTIDIKELDKFYFSHINFFKNNHYLELFKEGIEDIIEDINKKEKRLLRKLKEEKIIFYYLVMLLLFSILLDSDKTDAANLEYIKRKKIEKDIVENYKLTKFNNNSRSNNINKIRNKIYNEVVSFLNTINLDKNKILSINVPTGLGKTLTSLSFSIKLKEKLEKEKNINPRIIYTLPFLSIIDQNANVFSEILNDPPSNILLKHHHLSEINYNIENEFENIKSEKDVLIDQLFIEGWNSEIIVTTFMQFFHSILSNKNRMIRKFHNITNSIVILDEIQSIPHKYWLLMKQIIVFLAKYFNIYFIFVTATQPLIFNKNKNEIFSLLKNECEYFNKLNRINLHYITKEINLEDFKSILKNDLMNNPNKNFLIVLNTIKSSKNVYEFIKNKIKNHNKSNIYYLSSNIYPYERLDRIRNIKNENKKRKIVVSTQLIEAGVDVDFDIVYRDFAPFDCINQVSGRCNRNSLNQKGEVKIVRIIDSNTKRLFCSYIYDSFLISKTENVFQHLNDNNKNNVILSENNFYNLINTYFEEVNKGISYDISLQLLDNLKNINFSNLTEFRLIENDFDKINVFIEFDDRAEFVLKRFKKIISDENLKPLEKKKELLRIKNIFNDYIISVNKTSDIINNLEGIGNLRIILKDQIDTYYDKEIGFKQDIDQFY